MRDILIADDKTLEAIYGDLLRWDRCYQNELKAGTTICRCCSQKKADHMNDGRCSTSALSREFVSDELENAEKVSAALDLIEKLKALSI